MAPPPPVEIEWPPPVHHGPPSRLRGWSNKVAGILTFDKRLRYRGQSEMDAARFQQEHYRRNGWWPFQRQYPGAMPPMHQQYASAPAALGTTVPVADPYAYGQGRRWWPFARRRYPTEHHHHGHEHEHGGSHHGHSNHHGHGSHHGHDSHHGHTRPTYVTDGGQTEVYDAPGVRVEVHRTGGRKLSRSQSHPHRLQRSQSRRREPEYYDARLQRYRTVHPDFSARYQRHWGHADHRCVPEYFGLWCLIKGYLTGNDALKHRGRMERDYAKRERRKERRRRWALFKAEMWARRHGHRTPFTL